MEQVKNLLYKEFGTYLKTNDTKFYKIKNVYIFKDGVIKVISNYFIDNFKDYQGEFFGEVKKKNKIDLQASYNFVVKTLNPSSWSEENEQDLYINGDINNYAFIGLSLNGERLDIEYNLNGEKMRQCIGWNHKEKYKKQKEITEALKKLDSFRLDYSEYEQDLNNYIKLYKKYKKVVEKEKQNTAQDYKKMTLASGTTEEQNKMMLKNNGLEV